MVAGAGEVFALLIAGSAGWGNYRHQADVLHVSMPQPLSSHVLHFSTQLVTAELALSQGRA